MFQSFSLDMKKWLVLYYLPFIIFKYTTKRAELLIWPNVSLNGGIRNKKLRNDLKIMNKD